MLRKLKKFKIKLLNLVAIVSLIGCSFSNITTDSFQLWGQAICLNNDEKKVVSKKNLNYYIKHNEMLGIKTCKDLNK